MPTWRTETAGTDAGITADIGLAGDGTGDTVTATAVVAVAALPATVIVEVVVTAVPATVIAGTAAATVTVVGGIGDTGITTAAVAITDAVTGDTIDIDAGIVDAPAPAHRAYQAAAGPSSVGLLACVLVSPPLQHPRLPPHLLRLRSFLSRSSISSKSLPRCWNSAGSAF